MAAEKKTVYTPYQVLKEKADGGWETVQVVSASSAQAAIRLVVSKLVEDKQTGKFVAPPARSWKPMSVKAKTTVRLELTEVKP